MKKIISIIITILFVFGLYMIRESGSGIFGDYISSLMAGSILTIFSGIRISIVINSFFKQINGK